MKPIFKKISVALLALGLCVTLARAATYYVDSGAAGNDSNNGTSSSTPWKTLAKINATTFAAGDSLLLVRGGSWTGRLHPLGSGSSSAAITIDAYGTGSAPLIQGAGTVSEAVLLSDQQYWDVKNLEITNQAGAEGTRYGMRVLASDFGTVHHIHLVDLEVHDVTGDSNDKDTGGILFDIVGTATATKFDDLLIDGCYVHHVTRTGISIQSTWNGRTATTTSTWTPSTNVVIRNNVIAYTAANGLIWRVSTGPLIENNLWANCGQTKSGNAMFVFNCDNAVIQNNEAYGTVFTTGDEDAAGFDDDYMNKGTIIQYNYSHDNGLAGIVAVGPNTSFNQNPIIRYNILQDNAQQVFRVTGNVTNAKIYNNVIHTRSSLANVKQILHSSWGIWPSGTQYRNNIFNNLSTSSTYSLGSSTNNTIDYNLFYGQHPASEPADAHKLTTDPKFVAPGTGANGMNTVDGYKLQAGSPALDSGVLVSGNGGLDYFGNTVSASAAPHRGAYNGAPIAAVAAPVFSPTGGTFTNTLSVTMTTATSGASIRYTTDGSTPSATNGTLYTAPVAINSTTAALKAVAYLSSSAESTITSDSYTLQAAAPTFSPTAGTFSTTQSVAIASSTSGASIRYTTDGSTPTSTTGTLYSAPVAITVSTTLKAIAYRSGFNDSTVTSGVYTLKAVAPAFSPGGGTYASAQSVTITTTTSGASIRYTTDGSTPTSTTGTLYTSAVAIASTTTLKAIAYKSGWADSDVTTAVYTITLPQVAAPAFSPAGGSFTTAQSVTITSATSGASIRYTTDGSTPTSTTGTLYSGAVSIATTTTLKAIAYKSGMADSAVTTDTYTFPTTITAEFETMTVDASSGDATTAIADAAASGGQWLKYAATATADFVTFSLNVPAGTYQIQVRIKAFTDRGTAQLATSGDGVTFFDKDGPKDFYAATATYPTITYTTQVTFPSTGTKYFRFTVTGKNAASTGYVIPLDLLTLTPQ